MFDMDFNVAKRIPRWSFHVIVSMTDTLGHLAQAMGLWNQVCNLWAVRSLESMTKITFSVSNKGAPYFPGPAGQSLLQQGEPKPQSVAG